MMDEEPVHKLSSIHLYETITPSHIALSFGRLLRHQGKDAAAEDIYRDALHNFRLPTAADFCTASTLLQELLTILSNTNKLERAMEYYQTVIDNFRTSLGPLHWATLSIVLETGVFLRQHGQLMQTQQLYEHSVELSENNLNSNNASLFCILHDLAVVYSAQNKLCNAEAIYQMALFGFHKIHGPRHHLTQKTIINLGGCYRDQGKLYDAAKMYYRAAYSFADTLGMANTTTIATFNQLTAIHIKTRNLEAAEDSCLSALNGTTALYGNYHEMTLLTTLDLGVVYRDQMKLEESRTTLRGLLLAFRGLMPDSEAIALNCLGTVNVLEGYFDEAEQNFEKALDGLRALETNATMQVLFIIYNLGVLHEAQEKAVEAENSYQKAFEGFRDFAGWMHISTLTAADSLANLYFRQGRLADAGHILSQVLSSCNDEVDRGSAEQAHKDAKLTLDFQRMTISRLRA